MLDRRGFLKAPLFVAAAPAILSVLDLPPADDGWTTENLIVRTYLQIPAGCNLGQIRDLLLPGLTNIQIRYATLPQWREIFPT